MKKLYFVICGKYRKFEKPKILYLVEKTLVLYVIWGKCKNKDEKIFKEENLIEILKIFGLMAEENTKQKSKLKNIDGTKNYLTEEMNQNELISKQHKKVCATINYTEHFLISASAITGWVSISAFTSLFVTQ